MSPSVPYEIIHGDVLDVLPLRAEGSIHCVITSPPYYGLRDYGSPSRAWGGDPGCEHQWGGAIPQDKRHQWTADNSGEKHTAATEYPKARGAFCSRCYAWFGAFGLEPTPEMYVEHAVMIFREVRRVLRDDGTFWLNIGDSYAGGGHGGGGAGRGGLDSEVDKNKQAPWKKGGRTPPGLKDKDLIGIPWMLAFALRADGWYLRSDNLWSKLNALPESVKGSRWERCRKKKKKAARATDGVLAANISHANRPVGSFNSQEGQAEWEICSGCSKCSANGGLVLRRGSWRPTRAHEYVFQFTKTADYYSDGEAVKEKAVGGQSAKASSFKRDGSKRGIAHVGQNVGTHREDREDVAYNGEHRNKRSVWTFASQPFKEAHFAVFPPALVEPCILSSTSEYGCCSACGAPYARIVERTNMVVRPSERREEAHAAGAGSGRTIISGTMLAPATTTTTTTIGWKRTCGCTSRLVVPATVLDPFNGAGTTGVVSKRHGLRYVGIDLNPDYCEMSRRRIAATPDPDPLDDSP